MNNDYIYLIVGPSGSGKSTVVSKLKQTYGWKDVESYTTRPKRFKDEPGHIFVDKQTFDALPEKCAYTLFDGNEYCATTKQVNNSDVYIIDPAGIDYFVKSYRGYKIPVAVLLQVSDGESVKRMGERGDSALMIQRRIVSNLFEFNNFELKLKNVTNLPIVHYNTNYMDPDTIARCINEDRTYRGMRVTYGKD